MNISRVGFSSVESTTITLPGTPQAGDLMIIWSFRDGSTTNPTVPSGWTSTGDQDGSLCSAACGYRIFVAGDTSGTWTNASGLICVIYRNTSTSKTPLGVQSTNTGATNTIQYLNMNPLKNPRLSWGLTFVGHTSIDTTIETPQSFMTLGTNTVGTNSEYVGFDSNGPINSWPLEQVVVTGTAAAYMLYQFEVFADQTTIRKSISPPYPFSPGRSR